jgi:hypothetical protein
MKIGNLVRRSAQYIHAHGLAEVDAAWMESFEVVATFGAHVTMKALATTEKHQEGELVFAEANDLWVFA